jgi:thiosulfate dehydrogenase
MKTSYKILLASILAIVIASRCTQNNNTAQTAEVKKDSDEFVIPDTSKIPHDQFGEMVRYGRQLMTRTAYYIGPHGVAGKYLGNRMNCTNCHQDAGTKPFAFNLVMSHANYPQYRAREGRVLTMAERVNNCVMRPHNGKPLPLDSKEMVAFLSYFRWLNSQVPVGTKTIKGEKNLQVEFPERAADPQKGAIVYETHCKRCHGDNGQGLIGENQPYYTYPLLWGDSAYQPGSSMHRVIKQAQWLKANMPYDSAKWNKPVLSDEQALDVAAFVNDDRIHKRPNPASFDYPHPEEKAIDYDKGPFFDNFAEEQHKFGPYKPIIEFWKSKGLKAAY